MGLSSQTVRQQLTRVRIPVGAWLKMNLRSGAWVLSVVLALPAFVPLIAHYVGFARIGLIPAGFIQYDLPYYIANARELSDSGGLRLTYGNPFSFDYNTPRIYFQPLTLLLGIAYKIFNPDPGVLLAIFGVITAVLCVRSAIALVDHFTPPQSSHRSLIFLLFVWGGGLLTAASLLFSYLQGQQAQGMFFLDPVRGWWFLNFGRNLVYATEALYHAIFFVAVLLLVKRRFVAALVALVLMSASHPFTGLQLLGIVVAWSLLEIFILRSKVIPLWFLLATITLTACHIGYYLVFLSSFPEHRALQEQWTLPLVLPFASFVFANIIVGAFAVWRMRSVSKAKDVLMDSSNRLLLVWFVVTALLVNHDLFIRPVQPLHFSRGYLWIPLFLLGIPSIISLLDRIHRLRSRSVAALASLVLVAVFLSDNASWIIARSAQALGHGGPFGLGAEAGTTITRVSQSTLGIGITRNQAEVLRVLNTSASVGHVVIAADSALGYLTTVYTPLRSWRSHPYNTPHSAQREKELREFFDHGHVNPAWSRLPVLAVLRADGPWQRQMQSLALDTLLLQNSEFVIAQRKSAIQSMSAR